MPDPFQILEFDQVQNILIKYLRTFSGKALTSSLMPGMKARPIAESFALIREMTDFLVTGGILQFDEIGDISESLLTCRKDGALLGIPEILELRKTLENYSRNRNALAAEDAKCPKVSERFAADHFSAQLVRRIESIMDRDGVIYDHASEELRRIRKRKGSIRGEIQGKLNARMSSENMGGAIQDKIITIRDGRFVIPIRSQFKNKVRSEMNYIVHSFSKTGETVFVEPEDVVYLNNEMIEIDELEMEEIRRILRDLTGEIGREADGIETLSADLGVMESLYGRARFARDYRCGFPEVSEDKSFVSLINARHPLLGLGSVPITIDIGNDCQGLVISGPNAGGKTVALKTVGLLILMAQSAIPIPADSASKIGVFKAVLPEIGDEQSIAENLSSFSGHILSLSRIIEQCDAQTLVLVDEIASSTEPKEGEAIGRQIILELIDRGAKFIVTTHFQGIKEIGYTDGRVKNAFVEFDEEKLLPKYRLAMNGTGSSYALKVARKYGMPEEMILSAEKYLEERATDTEKALRSMESERNLISRTRSELEERISESAELKEQFEKELKELRHQKEQLEKKGIKLLKKELDDALSELSTLKGELRNRKCENVKEADETIGRAMDVLKKSEIEQTEKLKKHPETLELGMRVFVSTYSKEGNIEEIKDDKVKVRIGIISTVVDKGEIFVADVHEEKKKSRYNYSSGIATQSNELDLRGFLLEEALQAVEKCLDSAVMNGTTIIHIIHGKGEGILRKGIWDYLKTLDFIKSYQYAKPEEGGQGKTIVFLK